MVKKLKRKPSLLPTKDLRVECLQAANAGLRAQVEGQSGQINELVRANAALNIKVMDLSVSRPSRDRRFLARAKVEADSSKDPSTRVGAVVVRNDGTVASAGYNGFPRGVQDTPARYADREFKLQAVVHAETNAIVNAREPLHGMTMYATLHPCAQCAALIVQAGIKRVVCEAIDLDEAPERWRGNMKIAQTILREGGVLLDTPKDH